MAKEYDSYRPLRTSSDDGSGETLPLSPYYTFLGISVDSPMRRRLALLILLSQGLLNVVLVATGLYYYAHRGPSNVLFPRGLYCGFAIKCFRRSLLMTVFSAPAEDVLSFKVHEFYEGFGENVTIYQHDPSDEVDKAWEDLYSVSVNKTII